MTDYTFGMAPTELEVARGFDGMLGLRPSPAIVTALYACGHGTTILMTRDVHDFKTRRPFPSRCKPIDPRVVSQRVGGRVQAFLALFIAVEVDGREDLQRLYGVVERTNALSFWTERGLPDPESLQQLASLDYATAHPVHLLVDGIDAEACSSDKWIGASVCVFPAESFRTKRRVHFISKDGRNDWTLLVKVEIAEEP